MVVDVISLLVTFGEPSPVIICHSTLTFNPISNRLSRHFKVEIILIRNPKNLDYFAGVTVASWWELHSE